MARPTGSCPPGRKPLLSDRKTALGRRSFRPSPCRGRHPSSPRRRGGSNIHSYFWPMWLKYSFPLVAQILVPTWLKYSLTFTTAIILLSNRQSCFEKVRVFKAFQPFEYYSHSTNPIIWGCISYTLTGITFANLLIFYLLFLAANFLSIKIVSQKAGEYNYLLHRFPGYSAIENTLIYRKFSFIALDAFRSGRSRHPWTL